MRRSSASCEQLLARFSDHLDLDLSAEERRDFEKHLRRCGRCQEFAGSLRCIVELCRGFEPGLKPHPLTPRARAELEKAWRRAIAGRTPGLGQHAV